MKYSAEDFGLPSSRYWITYLALKQESDMIMSVFPIDNWVSFIEKVLESPTTYSAGLLVFFLFFLLFMDTLDCSLSVSNLFFTLYFLLSPLSDFLPSPTLAWKIPWTEEPGRLQSMVSWRVGHDWATSLSLFTFMHWRREWNPLQCSCLENPRDGGAWWAAVSGVTQSRTRLTRLSSSSNVALL